MTKYNVSFTIIELQSIFRDSNEYHDNEILYYITENNQKQASVTLEASTQKEAELKSKSLIQKSLAKLCFAFQEESSIIQNGYTIKDLDNYDKFKVCKSFTMRFNILGKGSIEPNKIISLIESLKPEKKMY